MSFPAFPANGIADQIDRALAEPDTQGTLSLAVGLAAQLLKASMVAIGIRGGHQWTNYLFGLDPEWQHRELPLIDRIVACEGLFVHAAPVPGIESMNFLAAVAIRSGGIVTGVLLVMDSAARQIDEEQANVLNHLGTVVRDALELATGKFEPGEGRERPTPGVLAMRVDLGGRILRIDAGTERRLGYGEGTLAGRNLSELIEPSEMLAAMDGLLAQFGAAGSMANNLRLVTASGDRVLVRAQTRLAFERGVPVAVDFVAHDFSSEAVRLDALQHAERALTDKAEELARFSEHLRQLHRLATTEYPTVDDLLTDYLRSGSEILRLPLGMVTQTGAEQMTVRAMYPATPGILKDAFDLKSSLAGQTVTLQETFGYPYGVRRLDAMVQFETPFTCYIGTPIYAGDELFGSLGFCSTQPEDVRRFTAHELEVLELMAKSLGRSIYEEQLRRERARLTVELARQALQDPLTGLSNRTQFMKHLDSALARATQQEGSLAVAFVDLDRFKQVNDTFGHAVGDEILRQVAARLVAEVAQEVCVARVGGDEFTILFGGNPGREEISRVVQRLLESLRAPYPVDGSELFMTGTVGISFFPDDGTAGGELLQKADAAMYRAKSQGKNDFRFFTPDIVMRSTNRMELEMQLRRALENREMRIAFMPLVSAGSGTLEGMEALLSWNNQRFGNVGPSRFIPIAEESGMIIPIGAWVLREVCRQIVLWQSRGLRPVRVAINVSSLQFARTDFVDLVADTLRETGLAPQCLELELTESIIMRDVEGSVRRMSQLREVGVSIAIDDFGTGYSSLSYLRRLPVDALKIDQSFVAELGASGTAVPLIHTIVLLAHNIGLSVVAEGVETREQLELLRAVGCDKVQGHLFGEPLTADSIENLMRRAARDVPVVR